MYNKNKHSLKIQNFLRKLLSQLFQERLSGRKQNFYHFVGKTETNLKLEQGKAASRSKIKHHLMVDTIERTRTTSLDRHVFFSF